MNAAIIGGLSVEREETSGPKIHQSPPDNAERKFGVSHRGNALRELLESLSRNNVSQP